MIRYTRNDTEPFPYEPFPYEPFPYEPLVYEPLVYEPLVYEPLEFQQMVRSTPHIRLPAHGVRAAGGR